jgi:uncharacterized protein (TIGR02596 family)
MDAMKTAFRAFSLLELLVVVAIIGGLSVLAIPALTSVAAGTDLTRGGQLVADQLILARQEATGKNRDVQVRFVWRDDVLSGYRGVQLWAPSRNDITTYLPVSRIVWMPEGTLISSATDLSPLVADPSILEATTNFPGRGPTKYCGFRFRPGGGTDLNFNSTSNYLTVLRGTEADATTAPANCAIIQVDPVNGHVRTYRP